MITVKNVTKKYGKFKAVDNISFEINDGEIIGLLGPNGAGKSTTMNILTGFIEPTEGEVIINGYNISKKPKKAKKCIGYMPEGVPLYKDMTVKEFVTYMAELKGVKKEQIKESVDQAIQDTWLQNVRKVLIRNLSKGYKQRVSMAGALVGNPEIIILDEPTVGLDPKQIIEIRNLIKKLGKNHTLIISSHILSEISQICERVIIINKGQIVAVDSPVDPVNGNQQVDEYHADGRVDDAVPQRAHLFVQPFQHGVGHRIQIEHRHQRRQNPQHRSRLGALVDGEAQILPKGDERRRDGQGKEQSELHDSGGQAVDLMPVANSRRFSQLRDKET